jgi:hypothetical protein
MPRNFIAAAIARHCFYKPRCQIKLEEKFGERVMQLCKILYSYCGCASYYLFVTVAGKQNRTEPFSVSLAQFNLIGTVFDLL